MVRGELTSREGAELLALSVRQAKRLRSRFIAEGAKGLVHGNLSKPSNHSHDAGVRIHVLELIRERYGGKAERGAGQRLGPTLVAEQLLEDEQIDLPVSTLRRWMKDEGLWTRKRKWYHRFRRRESKPHFGELVQLDGSFHEWLEERGPGGCLMTMADDATSTQLALLGKEESFWPAHNARFAREPKDGADYHFPLLTASGRRKPEDIWCLEDTRQLSNDGVICYENRKFQVTERRDMPPRSKVLIRVTKGGGMRVVYRRLVEGVPKEDELKWHEYHLPGVEPVAQPTATENPEARVREPWRPGPRHPWRLMNQIDVVQALENKRDLELYTAPEALQETR
jgi:hypothetical protein